MATATQLNLTLPNTMGTLARLCRDLADGGVNLLALATVETDGTTGLVRLVVANPELATRAVAKAGYDFTTQEVLFIELKNRPGALAKATEKLHRAGIGIHYAYATAYAKAQKTAAVIAVREDDFERGARLMAGR
jgi:hypothetical protein